MKEESIYDFDQLAEELHRAVWGPWYSQMIEKWPGMNLRLRNTLLDFYCVLRYQKRYEQLKRGGDDGFFKLADVFSNPLQHPAIRERHQRAVDQNDKEFLQRFSQSIGERSSLDPRKDKLYEVRKYLFLNWEIPLLNPDLVNGLWFRTNKEILALLAKAQEGVESPIEWDENRLTKELTKLKLNRKK